MSSNNFTPNPQWRDLYRIGYLSTLAMLAGIVLAVAAFFIWPYTPGESTIEQTLQALHQDVIGGLAAIDTSVVLVVPIMLLQWIALYAALKHINESYALIALVFGLIGGTLWLVDRPALEMVFLSRQYAEASSAAEQAHFLAAAEAVHSLFNGTAWIVSQFFINISGVILEILMFRHPYFRNATAIAGLVLSGLGLLFWIPAVGPILSLIATVGGIVWYLLMAGDFLRLFKATPKPV